MLLSDTDQLDDLMAFLSEWLGHAPAAFGVSQAEIPRFLPAAKRDLYAFAGRWPHPESPPGGYGPSIFQQQDYLYPIERCTFKDGYLEFLRENQGNWSCRVNAGNPHSPVFSNARMLWDENADGFEMCRQSLPHFLKTFCLQELVLGSRSLYTVCIKTGGRVGDLGSLFRYPLEEIWLHAFYSHPYGDGPTYSFYRCKYALIMLLHGEIFIGINSAEPLKALLGELPPLVSIRP